MFIPACWYIGMFIWCTVSSFFLTKLFDYVGAKMARKKIRKARAADAQRKAAAELRAAELFRAEDPDYYGD